jgi:hypothetical protein
MNARRVAQPNFRGARTCQNGYTLDRRAACASRIMVYRGELDWGQG